MTFLPEPTSVVSADPYPVSEALLQERRRRAAAAWAIDNGIVLVGSGNPISIPGGADQTFGFRVHPHFQWLTGLVIPGSILAFDPQEGWTEFLHRTTVAERVWEGAPEVDRGENPEQLGRWLESRAARRIAYLGGGSPVAGADMGLSADLDAKLLHTRRRKDSFEIEAIRKAIAATAVGFAMLPSLLYPGVTEREVRIELERAMFRAGGERTAYDTIVGFGSNSAVLHFQPSGRRASQGDIVLVDAGVDIGGYVADVTRVFPIEGTFGSEAAELYDRLLGVQKKAIERCTAGTEWCAVHEGTVRDLAGELVEMGVLRCSADEAVESETIALFMPHGVGHMVGLGVRDAGGSLAGRATPAHCCGISLRADLPLEEGYVMTVEPGVYFIPALLNDPEVRAIHRDAVDWSRAESLARLGGMRIEDDVLITSGAPEILTAGIPK